MIGSDLIYKQNRMMFRHIQEAHDLKGKKVLVRVDFNVELTENNDVVEHFKLDIAKETVDYLLQQEVASISLLSHFGRPDGTRNEKFSLYPLLEGVKKAIGHDVLFVSDCKGQTVVDVLESAQQGEVFLLENVRFYPEEEKNDNNFSHELAQPFDIFVNDAFSACHRAHASISGIVRHIESYAGFRLVKEVEYLEKVKTNPEHPAVAIIGGAKIETKLPLIRTLEKAYDAVLVGGRIANEAVDQQVVFSDKVVLPQDFQGNERFDIGTKTAAQFAEIIQTAKTIVWNGPMGKFEEKPYDTGTLQILHAILGNKEAFSVIGGGESLAVVEQNNAMDKISFVSAGGGAMLDFLGGSAMPGLNVLNRG